MQYLTFMLHGLVQAWGGPVPNEARRCLDHPGKSGVGGYLGAALGLTEGDELAKLSSSLWYACRVNSPGTPFEDYQTACMDGVNTNVSTRGYIAGAEYTVCLWAKDNSGVQPEALRDAILQPVFDLYLGRKNCRQAHPMPTVVKAAGLAGALLSYNPPIEPTGTGNRVFFEGPCDLPVTRTHIRYDEIAGVRKYGARLEKEGVLSCS